MLKETWLQKIFNNEKYYEIRGTPGHNVLGTRIFLCQSGTKTVYGHAYVAAVLGPLDDSEWERLRPGHLVEGPPMYASTYAWHLADVKRLQHPVLIKRKRGSVGIQVGL